MAVQFPELTPSSRSYTAGEYPQTTFTAQNGVVTVMRYGNRAVNSRLQMEFVNITDDEAEQIMVVYRQAAATYDNVTFSNARGLGGVTSPGLRETMDERPGGVASGLKYRFESPPSVASVMPGFSTVSCSFIGVIER